mgnify:CR=1 FL=1
MPVSPELYAERMACYQPTEQELVLLSGWSMDTAIWRSLLPQLRSLANITLIDLPSTGGSPAADYELPGLLDAILKRSPQRAYFLGWSLGGSLALALAQRSPSRVAGVLAAATNPSFVATEDWPWAMPAIDFDSFYAQVEKRGQRALGRFDLLQASGGSHQQASVQRCRQLRGGVLNSKSDMPSLLSGLRLLRALDHTQLIPSVPLAFLFAADDGLVPAAAAAAVRQRLSPLAVEVAADCNHLLPLFAGDDIVRLLGVLGCLAPPVVPTQRDKTAVARSFGSAAASYDGVAGLQRDIGNALLGRHLPQASAEVTTVLDLGCGTGYFRHHLQQRCPQAAYLGMDLAEGMARHAALEPSDDVAWLVGDAEDMPLASGSMQLVFSNLAIQWSENVSLLCTELARVLAPGGRGLLATLGPQTLRELRRAWSVVDGHAHVNQFVPVPQLQQALQDAGLHILSLEQEERVMVYQHARELLRELKDLGAHNVNASRPAGLTGRRRLEAFYQAYEDQRRDEGLPATYDVIYLEVTRAHG